MVNTSSKAHAHLTQNPAQQVVSSRINNNGKPMLGLLLRPKLKAPWPETIPKDDPLDQP